MAFQREPQACQLRHAAPTMSPTSSRTNPATARRIAAPKPARPHLSSLQTSFSHPFRSPASPASHLLSNLVRQHQSLHHPASVLSSRIHTSHQFSTCPPCGIISYSTLQHHITSHNMSGAQEKQLHEYVHPPVEALIYERLRWSSS
jgi:hypothetical protein